VKHFLLFYLGATDDLERRPQFRAAHLKHPWAEEFARADPYVLGGLVERWHVREWPTVVGEIAATPVRPDEQ
jgi:hypothetical protein